MNRLCSLLCMKYRRCFQTAHFYVEDSSSPRVVPNESIPVIPIPDDMEAISVKQFIKHISDLYANNLHGFSEDFEFNPKLNATLTTINAIAEKTNKRAAAKKREKKETA
ncbi:receptor-type tyrosine-protein phosphatase gamma isoform X3 [Tachysurus ichikawai]